MARLFKQEYTKTRVVRGDDGRPVRDPQGRYVREPIMKGGKPVRVKAKKWTVEFRDHRGRVRRKAGYPDRAATEQLAAKLEARAARIDSGMLPPETEEAIGPIAEHVESYTAHLQAAGYTARHVAESTGRLTKVLEACGFRRLVDIKAGPVERFLIDLMRPGKDTPGRAPRTRNMYLNSLRAFVHWVIRQKLLESDPLAGIDNLNEQVDQRRKRRAATDAELLQLIAATQTRTQDAEVCKFMVELRGRELTTEDQKRIGKERALVYKTLALTGLRVGELRQVVWSDVDLENGWLDVRAAVAKNREGDSQPLRADLIADLRAWFVECGRPDPDALVFRVPKLMCRVLKKDLAYAGIEYQNAAGFFDVHSLRHTTGTRLTNSAAVPIRTAQEFMRHSDIRLTTATYTDPRFVDKRRALEALPVLPLDGKTPGDAEQANAG